MHDLDQQVGVTQLVVDHGLAAVDIAMMVGESMRESDIGELFSAPKVLRCPNVGTDTDII